MEKIRIKGIKNGFKIVILENAPFEEIYEEIIEKVNNTMELIRLKKELTLEIEGGNLSHENKCTLTKDLLVMLDFKAVISYISEKELKKRTSNSILSFSHSFSSIYCLANPL